MRRVMLTMVIVAAACGGVETGGETSPTTTSLISTSTSPSTTATTTSTTTTVTTQPVGPRDIGVFTRFEAATRYRGILTAVDLSFELAFDLDGWRVVATSANGDLIHLENHSRSPGANVGVLLWMADNTTAEVADWYLSNENVVSATEPIASTLGSLPALEFDFLLAPGPAEGSRKEPCDGRILLVTGGTGEGDTWVQHVQACTWTRIYVVDFDGVSVSVIASAGWDELDPDLDPWQIEDFQPLLDDFVNGITFCTEATPCDG